MVKKTVETQESAEAVETKRPATEVEQVVMEDGRTVAFSGKRRMLKDVIVDGQEVSVRFDFRNGATRTFVVTDANRAQLAGHGAAQKIGDETAGVEDLDDAVIAVDDMIARLNKGEWTAARAAGDGFSGASVVIKAICEVTGKAVEFVKGFLQSKLDAAAAKGEKLSRAELYASFRNPTTKTGAVIARLESEKKAKVQKVDANDLMAELEG